MSKKIKIVLAVFLLFFVGLGSLIYFISSKIDPEIIKEKAEAAIEESLPGSRAVIKEVSYTIGLSVSLNVKGLEILREQSGNRLFYVEDALVEVPVWAVLTNGGTLDVKVLNPELVYRELPGNTSNWQKVLPEPEKETKAGAKKESKEEEKEAKEKKTARIELPNFIEKSRVDFKITDLNIRYLPLNKAPTNVLLNKILFKNVNLKKTTAYEIVSNIDYGIDEEKSIQARAQVIGEVALNNLLQTGALDTNLLLNVENARLSWLDVSIPALKNVIKFQMGQAGDIQAEVRTTAGNILNLETNLKMDEAHQKLDVDKLQLAVNLGNLSPVLPNDIKKEMNGISFGKSRFNLNGSASFDIAGKKLHPNLAFFLDKPIGVAAAQQQIMTGIKGRFVGEELALKIKSELLSGVATFDASTTLDLFNLPDDLRKYAPIKSKLLVTNMKLEKPFLQKTLYGQKEQGPAGEETTAAGVSSGSLSEPEPISFPPFEVDIEGKHIFISNQETNLTGSVFGKGDRIRIPALEVRYGSGTAVLKGQGVLKTAEDISSSFNLALKNMNLDGLNAFLPPILSEIRGRYEGKVSGAINKKKSLAYDVSANVEASDGELKNLNLASFIMPLIQNLPLLKDKVDSEKLKLTDKFEKLDLGARATEKFVHLKKFAFIGNNRSLILNAKGKIAMNETAKSKVTAQAVVSEIAEEVKAYSGSSDIPLLFEGQGFGLLPQFKYTTDKLAERMAKVELTKQKSKVEKQIEKEKDKLEKELKNKAKDLLKGFKL